MTQKFNLKMRLFYTFVNALFVDFAGGFFMSNQFGTFNLFI